MVLLDVNLLIALCDADHVHHERARAWFRKAAVHGWGTCPLTENALVRIMGHPEYPGGPGSVAAVRPLLEQLRMHPAHVFLADRISLADAGLFPDLSGATSKDLTDLYLLALAVHHGAKFASLDKRINASLVPGGVEALMRV